MHLSNGMRGILKRPWDTRSSCNAQSRVKEDWMIHGDDWKGCAGTPPVTPSTPTQLINFRHYE